MKLKRILAVAMATVMVMGMSITALAADGDATGSGGATGSGASEGHVEQKHMNVVLPTDADTSTFAYTIDPERLIQTTNGGKYAEGTVFPEAAGDTGVYFLVGEKTYANTSKELQVINKSSADVKVSLTVKTTATAGDKDIPLATAALTDSETAAKLYLAATIGEGSNKSTQILSASGATIDRKLAGTPGNYEIIVGENASHQKEYQYTQKTSGLTAWKALKFSITGAVTKDKPIAADTTAPTINVTWAFAEPTASDSSLTDDGVGTYSDNSGPSIATTGYTITANTPVAISVNLGAGSLAATSITGITYKNANNQDRTLAATDYTFENGTLTIKASVVDSLLTISNFTSRTYTVTFDNDATATFTLNKE